MATKRTPGSRPEAVTADRAARLLRLIALLQAKPQTRDYLRRRLRIDVRSFYRDLDLLRAWGIAVPLHEGRYALNMDLPTVYGRVPFPDPRLSLAEAMQLARGRTAAHRKLKMLIAPMIASGKSKKR